MFRGVLPWWVSHVQLEGGSYTHVYRVVFVELSGLLKTREDKHLGGDVGGIGGARAAEYD